MIVDQISRAFYEAIFEIEFLKKDGDAFQNFFCEIMELRYPGDFIRTRPWGNNGDQKNDGYLRSQRILFQAYGPHTVAVRRVLTKIHEDFAGAKQHWKPYFDTWVLVHNMRSVPPQVTKLLLDLDAASPPNVTDWSYASLRNELFLLSEQDIASILGPAPSQSTMVKLGYENLKNVLSHVARQPALLGQDTPAVSGDKLYANSLSEHVQTLLSAGMQRARRVGEFFANWYDPTYGDEIAQAFKIRYQELRQQGLTPDQIFYGLHEFAGGERRGTPDHESAVLAVLAYLFEKCDIFEEPRTNV